MTQAMAGLLYHNVMTPAWLRKPANADFSNSSAKLDEDLRVIISKDSNNYEKICRIPLLTSDKFSSNGSNISVKMTIGLELPGTKQGAGDGDWHTADMPTRPCDPIAFLITDSRKGMGMVLQDPSKGHEIAGPFYGIQGDIGRRTLQNPNTIKGDMLVRSAAKKTPDEFFLTLKPNENWGTAFTALDDGHKLLAMFDRQFDFKANGMFLEVFRIDKDGEFKINYIEVWVYEDN